MLAFIVGFITAIFVVPVVLYICFVLYVLLTGARTYGPD